MRATSSPREPLIRFVAALSLAFSVFYIVWRWGWTLNPDALWFSIPLAIAETYGLVTAFLMTVTAWKLKERIPRRAPAGRAVDVFVTTYDEPLTVIRKTALAAREIRYPHSTWILDDGKREEVRALAQEFGIGYLRREGNAHAKAGNLNHALENTSGEFILQLDADHVPLPHILDRLLGFFDDQRVAFVQSPQDFYNTDAFTYDVNQRARRIWEDQQLFFRILQPGKDRLGAAFFVGSCAVLRRAALDEIGGFATGTITEDIETSLLLHTRGWQSVYLNETLAYGLAPASAVAFHVQHLRWGQGAMQALRRYRPLTAPGLTLAQRLGYFDSLTTYLGGFQRLILYLAPIAFFFTGQFPLRASALAFAAVFLPYMALQVLSFKMLTRGHGSLLLADRYGMAKFWTHILSISGFWSRRALKFVVTPKGISDVPFRTYAPQLFLIILTVLAVAWSVAVQMRGTEDFEAPGWGALAYWVNLAFAAWNAGVAAYIVRMSLRMKQKRADHRFAEAVPVAVRVFRRDGRLVSLEMAVTENLNPFGVALRCMNQMDDGARVELALPLSTGEIQTRGTVVHRRQSETEYGIVYIHGIEFEPLSMEDRDAIELHCAHHATPIERQRYDEGSTGGLRGFSRLKDLRGERRITVGMPARVIVGANGNERDIGFGLLEDVSATGARILLEHPIAPNSLVRLLIPNTKLETSGRTAFVHTLETSVGIRFLIGLDTRPAMQAEPEPAVEAEAANPTLWTGQVRGASLRYGAAVSGAARSVGGRTRNVALDAARLAADAARLAATQSSRVAADAARRAADAARALYQAWPSRAASAPSNENETELTIAPVAQNGGAGARNRHAEPAAYFPPVDEIELPFVPWPREALARPAEPVSHAGKPAAEAAASAYTPPPSYEIPSLRHPQSVPVLQPLELAVEIPALRHTEPPPLRYEPPPAFEIPTLRHPEPPPLRYEPAPVFEIPTLRHSAPPPLRYEPEPPGEIPALRHFEPTPVRSVTEPPASVQPVEIPALEPVVPLPEGEFSQEVTEPEAVHPTNGTAPGDGEYQGPPEEPETVHEPVHEPPPERVAQFVTPVRDTHAHEPETHSTSMTGAEPMERQPISLQDYAPRPTQPQPQSQPLQPAQPGPAASAGGRNLLMSIAGAGARIEGTFHIADSIEIECEISGELNVGGRLVIGENAIVNADVQTVDAVIMGRYSGDLRASGSIEITSSGRVSGNMETNELVVAKGGIFTGNVTRPGDRPREQSPKPADVQTPAAQPQQAASARDRAKPEPARPSEKARPGSQPLSPATDRQALRPAEDFTPAPDAPTNAEETPPRPRSSKPRSWS